MTEPARRGMSNSGVQNTGSGTINVDRSAVGDRPSVLNVYGPEPHGGPTLGPHGVRWDVGVITVLSEETRAVAGMLAAAGSMETVSRSGLRFREAYISAGGKNATVVATQTLDRGQQPAVIAFERLRQIYAPAITVLVGIAGGISPSIRLGDVVVVRDVIYYDLRKETPTGVTRRGQSRPVPARIRHAINAFFSDHGEPYQASITDPAGTPRTCAVVPGPIGSGEAVVADKNSAIRRYLATVSDKTLALETEAGGLAEAFYEMADTNPSDGGWLAIRGIADHADASKDDSYHEIASWHAATIFRQMLPYLLEAESLRTYSQS